VGEVAKAILENKSSVAHTRSELVQVAAVAVAMVESLDRNGE
jgi:NTP pyrophosphatase (non-canonical NTP hydrolase)